MTRRLWTYEGYVPSEEGRREALCALGNGVFATRGAAPESVADGVHYPGTYAAGMFNRLTSELDDRSVAHESIVNLPNWLPLTHRPEGGPWFSLDSVEVLGYRQTLDLDAGVLHRHVRFTDRDGRTTSLRERRLVSMAANRVAALEQVIEPENWSGTVTIRSTIDGSVVNAGTAEDVRLANRHLEIVGSGARDRGIIAWLDTETTQSGRRAALASRTTVAFETVEDVEAQGVAGQDRPRGSRARPVQEPAMAGVEIEVPVARGRPVKAEKVVALSTSKDMAISEPGEAALGELETAGSFEQLLEAHRLAWAQLWERCHLSLSLTSSARSAGRRRAGSEVGTVAGASDDQADPEQGDPAAIVDLHLFHLLQTVSPNIADRDVGVPARGLHGEAYRGHIFWDELFVFPFLNLRFPQLTEELLKYRWRRLPAARRLADQLGCRGARFPWQSGSDGTEQTPTQLYNPRSGRWMPDHSRQQHHVGLAVAWNVWHFWQVTGDARFLGDYGAELLVEIARFFVDLATFDPSDGRWHLRGVMGPDEFHDGYPGRPGTGVDDNAYTNVLVAWLLSRALETHHILAYEHGGELWDRLGLGGEELQRWDHVRHHLAVPLRPDGTLAQFAGWEELAELDWNAYRERYGNIGRLDLILEGEDDDSNNYKLTKQADVLMLLYLFSADELVDLLDMLGYKFDPTVIPGMVDYYLARTANGSTLSHVAHSWVLSRANRPGSWPLLLDALQADVADTQGGTTREGIHLGAMAGTIDIVQRAYSGIEVRSDILRLNPHLPDQLDRLHFDVNYRGHWLHVSIDHARLQVGSRPCGATPVRLDLAGTVVNLAPGSREEVALSG